MSLRFFLLAALALVNTSFMPPHYPLTWFKMRYRIENDSKLYLQGTTNVNSFTCDCTDRFPTKELQLESQGNTLRFQQTGIQIVIQNFNCHNRKIETDLQTALKAKTYPKIGIELIESWQDAKLLSNKTTDWFAVQTKVRLSIAGVNKERKISAQAKVLGNNRFMIRGTESLLMSEFQITPPQAMFGLIKVNDLITFNFNLLVEAEEVEKQATPNLE